MGEEISSVYCVVLNYKNPDDTLDCLRSLKPAGVKIIVVDNCSKDGSVEKISREHPGLIILESGQNLGYAGGNNLGIIKAVELGASHVWVLNNDTVVDPGAASALLDVFNDDPGVGMAGSLIMYHDRPKEIWFAGGKYNPFTGLTSHYLENKVFDGAGMVLNGKKLDYVSGCSFMISAEAIRSCGMFDNGLFLLFEEMDICSKVKKAGFKIAMTARSVVYHKVSRTLKDSPLKLYYFTRNRLYISYRHYPLFLPFVILWCVRWPLLPALIKRRENLRSVLRAFDDFFKGIRGAYEGN